MKRFIQGEDRTQGILLPECLDDYVAEANPVRVVDVFVDELDLGKLGFEGVDPAATGRPAYHPSVLLKIYIYGYLNRIQSSRRLETAAHRNVELMWLSGRLMPDFKTIANFRKDNGQAIRGVCRQFVVLCRQVGLLTEAVVAIDGSKFKAVMGTPKLTEVAARGYFKGEEILAREQAGITAIVPKPLTSKSKAEGRFGKQDFVYVAEKNEYLCPAGQSLIYRYTNLEAGLRTHAYWSSNCQRCAIKAQCTPGPQ